MTHANLKKILACYSVAGLLTATVYTTACSKQEDTEEKASEQQTSQQQSVIVDDDLEKSKKPDGKEVQIRGKSG